jgi:galactose-3-O-sulfotransferase
MITDPVRVDKGEAVVFLHIPKTGGTTMSRILERQYRLRESFWTEWDRQSLQSFRNLPEKQRARIRLLYGHLAFGVHEVLPRPARYLTLLRDPIERAVSHYYFIRRTLRHPLHEKVVSRQMTLVDYVENPIANELVNGQTRLIAGVADGSTRDLEDPALLETAGRNIRGHFGLVGLAERFDESLLLAKEIFSWTRPVHYVRQNVTRRRPSLEDIPLEAVNVIRARNRLDTELYRVAKERLEMEIERRGGEFQSQLCSFRLDNFPHPLIRLKTLLPQSALRAVLTFGQRMVRGF